MNLAEAIAHGQAWVDAGWVWAPGQIDVAGRVVVELAESLPPQPVFHVDAGLGRIFVTVPDMRDPGTRGHALVQVEVAWGCELELVRVEVWDYPQGARVDAPGVMSVWWRVEPLGRPSECRFPTRAEALLDAFKCAPCSL